MILLQCSSNGKVLLGKFMDDNKELQKLQAYLSDKNENKERIYKFDILKIMLDLFYEISNKAIQLNSEENYKRVINHYKFLPIPYEEIYKIVTEERLGPPSNLITRIASNYFNQIYLLSTKLHNVLNRNREKVSADRVQQIDTACLQWLTRQPGRCAEEKAKNSQKILAVVRKENFNTLENRVFKEFLLRCDIECNDYLREYGEEFKEHPSVEKIRRLKSLIASILSNSIWDNISRLDGIPNPNYVLQNNALYNIIWKLYLELVMKNRQLNSIWKNRKKLLADVFYILQIAKINHIESEEDPIRHSVWIDPSSFDDFFGETCWNYINVNSGDQRIISRNQTRFDSSVFISNKNYQYTVVFNYITENNKPFKVKNIYTVNYLEENQELDTNTLSPRLSDRLFLSMMNMECFGV